MRSTRSGLVRFVALLGAVSQLALTPPEPAPASPLVLHIGDSFVNVGFAQSLRPRFVDGGARYVVRSEQSLYTGTILNKLRVAELIQTHRPQLVVVNLGANELEMLRPEDHAGAIRRVAATVTKLGASCVWVTPPPPANLQRPGIIDVIAKHSGPCRVFDSTSLAPKLPRQADKVHPTLAAGKLWAEEFWKWLQSERVETSGWHLKPISPTPSP